MNQAHRDYLDALTIARPWLTPGALRALALRVTVTPTVDPGTYIARQQLRRTSGETYVDWVLAARYTSLTYRVERLEIMLSIIVSSMRRLGLCSYDEAMRLVDRLGTDGTLLPDPRSRWRRIRAKHSPADMLPLDAYDDRPQCVCCRGRVSSGHERLDRHDNCSEYIQHVMLPALRAQVRQGLHRVNPPTPENRT